MLASLKSIRSRSCHKTTSDSGSIQIVSETFSEKNRANPIAPSGSSLQHIGGSRTLPLRSSPDHLISRSKYQMRMLQMFNLIPQRRRTLKPIKVLINELFLSLGLGTIFGSTAPQQSLPIDDAEVAQRHR